MIPTHRPLVFSVDGMPPSANQRMRMHWAKLRKEVQPFAEAIYFQAVQVRPKVPYGMVRLTVTLFHEHRGQWRDEDGAGVACKEMIDAVVRAGVMLDDSPAHCAFVLHQEVGSPRRVQLVVEPLEE